MLEQYRLIDFHFKNNLKRFPQPRTVEIRFSLEYGLIKKIPPFRMYLGERKAPIVFCTNEFNRLKADSFWSWNSSFHLRKETGLMTKNPNLLRQRFQSHEMKTISFDIEKYFKFSIIFKDLKVQPNSSISVVWFFNHVNEIDPGDKFYKKTTNEKKRPPTNTEDKRRNLRIIHKNVLLFRRGQRSLKNVRLWPLTQRFRLHLYSSFKRLKIINKSVSVFIYAILTNFIFALSKHNIHKW